MKRCLLESQIHGCSRKVAKVATTCESNLHETIINSYILETHQAETAAASSSSPPSSNHWEEAEGGEEAKGGWKARKRRRRPLPSSSALEPPELEIYEIGGGYGTNALCVLDYLQVR